LFYNQKKILVAWEKDCDTILNHEYKTAGFHISRVLASKSSSIILYEKMKKKKKTTREREIQVCKHKCATLHEGKKELCVWLSRVVGNSPDWFQVNAQGKKLT